MTRIAKFSAVLCVACLAGSVAWGAPFEQLFRIMKVSGDCSVKQPSQSRFVDAVEGSAYTYGTVIRTGRKSSALIQLSEGNECRVLAKAELTLAEDTVDPKLKIIKLAEGKVDIALQEDFHEAGNGLNVETATAVCGAIGCHFSAEAHKEQGINVIVFLVTQGKTKVSGMNFDIPEIAEGAGLSVSGDDNGSFTRIKTLKGSFDIHYKDSSGNPKVVTMEPNSIVKIWRRRAAAGNVIIVTVIVTLPDGTTEPAEVFTDKAPEGKMPGKEDEDGKGQGKGKQRNRIDITEDGVITITTTSSTTTTTTQPPAVTPVGKGRS